MTEQNRYDYMWFNVTHTESDTHKRERYTCYYIFIYTYILYAYNNIYIFVCTYYCYICIVRLTVRCRCPGVGWKNGFGICSSKFLTSVRSKARDFTGTWTRKKVGCFLRIYRYTHIIKTII